MASYSEEDKLECVGKLELLKEKGTINLDGVQIKNVRELVKFLGISSYSIYKWYKEIQYLARNMDLEKVKEELAEMMDVQDAKDFIKEFDGEEFNPDFSIENREMREGFEGKTQIAIEKAIENEIEPMTFKMGTTFFQTLAQGLGIKKYRMPLKQLYLKIGTELIKMSGLVENGVRKELRIE